MKRRRSPIRERRPKWVNGRIKRYGPSRAVLWRIAFGNLMARHMLPVISDARNNSYALWEMLKKQPRPTVTGKFIIRPMEYGRSAR